MNRELRTENGFAFLILAGVLLLAAALPAVEIGVARMDVTPSTPIRLTGFASRQTNSAGIEQRLWAKALAIGSDREEPALLLTLDNCGIAESTYLEVRRRLEGAHHLKAARLVIACSHTHCGPATTGWAPNIFARDIPADQQAVIDGYTRELIDKLEQVAQAALRDRRPGKLAWAQGRVEFAKNRRPVRTNSPPATATAAAAPAAAAGPVDHSLPVLWALNEDDSLRAVVANYACHCTTVIGDFNRTCGDWAGYAQEAIERNYPGATALITIGCGADANPSPRGGPDGGLAFAKQYGEAVGAEIQALRVRPAIPLRARLTARLKAIELPFGPHFTREQWEERAGKTAIVGYHAKKWLERLDRGEALPAGLSYYVQTWVFGADLALVFLNGEVVVDYVLRLKQEYDASRLWVTGYANYVPCYIPSRRILAEGGYEAEDSLWYYDRPARLAPGTEDLIIQTVGELMPKRFRSRANRAQTK